MKRIITSIAAAVSLVLLSFAVPVAASAQTTHTARTAQARASDSQPPYVDPCVKAIEAALRDKAIDVLLRDDLNLPKAAKIYSVYTTSQDVAEVVYEGENGKYTSVPFSVSIVVYDVLGLIPGTSPLWGVGQPATTCLEEAVIWDLQTGARAGAQLRKDLDKFLYRLVPTGLTVRADPSNGTVLLLTWHPHKTSPLASLLKLLKPGFQVSNGVVSRNAPAGPSTVKYTWKGLKPGSRACFKVRATYTLGDSAWDPNAAPWHVCAYTSSPSSAPPPGPCTPKIDAVGSFGATGAQTVEITGSCFGTGNTSSGADTAYFRISDLTADWNACWTGDPGTDSVTCSVSSWTNNEITFTGFTGDYGEGSWVVNSGDTIEVQVWNPQSGKGPATFEVTAGSGCTNPSGCVG